MVKFILFNFLFFFLFFEKFFIILILVLFKLFQNYFYFLNFPHNGHIYKFLIFFNSTIHLIFFLLIFSYFFFKKKYISHIILILILLMVFNITFIANNINIQLINILVFIHPFFLFFTIILEFYNIKKFNNFFYIKNIKLNLYNYNSNIYIIISFLLSMYWARQELFWGNWWNWDPIEISMCILLFLILLSTHINYTNNLKIHSSKKFIYILFFLIFLILNKSNIIQSIHSFTNYFIDNISNNYKYFYLYILIYVSIVYILFLLINFNNLIKVFFYKKILLILILFLFWCLYIILNFYVFNIINLNSIFYFFIGKYFIIYLYFITILHFKIINILLFFFNSKLIFVYYFCILFYINFFKINNLLKILIHKIFIIFITFILFVLLSFINIWNVVVLTILFFNTNLCSLNYFFLMSTLYLPTSTKSIFTFNLLKHKFIFKIIIMRLYTKILTIFICNSFTIFLQYQFNCVNPPIFIIYNLLICFYFNKLYFLKKK